MNAGYLDFDNMEVDSDLVNLRKAKGLPLPKLHVYQELKGSNGALVPFPFPFRILLPDKYSPGQQYSIVVSFAPGQFLEQLASNARE